MTVRTKPWIIDGNTHPAQDGRLAAAEMLGCDLSTAFTGGVPASAGLVVDPGHGVTHSSSMKVTQNGTPNMSVIVAAGGALIRGTLSALQGVYSVTNDAAVTLTISAANATNPRRDLIILQARDNAFDAGGLNDARLVVVAGTPAASPVDPSLTSFPNALVLARVAVAANATSITTGNITDLRSIAVSWAAGRGYVNHTALTDSFTQTTGTTADLTGLAVSFTAQTGRLYVARLFMPSLQRVSGVAGGIQIKEGSTVLQAGIVDGSNPGTFDVTANVNIESVPATFSAGSHTIKGTILNVGGTGNVTASGRSGSGGKPFIRIDDAGGALT